MNFEFEKKNPEKGGLRTVSCLVIFLAMEMSHLLEGIQYIGMVEGLNRNENEGGRELVGYFSGGHGTDNNAYPMGSNGSNHPPIIHDLSLMGCWFLSLSRERDV